MHTYLQPYWNQLVDGEWSQMMRNGRMTTREMQGWILQLYPFIHTFPKFLAESLIKVEDDFSRAFFIGNIRVEKHHATQWLWMGTGFGISKEEMLEYSDGKRQVLTDVQCLTDWLWYINARGSLPEAVAATSFAIEGVTGDIARKVISGFAHYADRPGVDVGPKTLAWAKAHAHYDDEHPKIALEIIKRYTTTEEMQRKVMYAARRSLQLLNKALITSYRAYAAPSPLIAVTDDENERRGLERRNTAIMLAFPDRRFTDRRGARIQLVA
jgi:pyrroloquinoline quinone (PQQ) biosynthesis protein C